MAASKKKAWRQRRESLAKTGENVTGAASGQRNNNRQLGGENQKINQPWQLGSSEISN